VYESALAEGAAGASGDAGSKAKFMQLEYGVETGEAERIAVDGVTRGDMDGDGESAGTRCPTERGWPS
jgi:COP9 signalosome complex subunit 6